VLPRPLPAWRDASRWRRAYVYDPCPCPESRQKYLVAGVEDVVRIGLVERVVGEVDVGLGHVL
jgi:hypothetical protein